MASSPQVARNRAAWLRRDAEKASGALPPLLVQAERLAMSVAPGAHGRRRSGPGEAFWQYRQATPGDPLPTIDWRRSARSDHLFVREMEWEAEQTVSIWADAARSMDYHSESSPRSKADRAALLALALAVLTVRGGERVGLLDTEAARPTTGETQLGRIAAALAEPNAGQPDYGAPPKADFARGGRAVFLSDFMGPRDEVFPALAYAAERGVSGCYIQIVDPDEELFPFDGRLVFQSMAAEVEFETHRARGLREAYLDRLAERRRDLEETARRCGLALSFPPHRPKRANGAVVDLRRAGRGARMMDIAAVAATCPERRGEARC